MHELVSLFLEKATESEARVYLRGRDESEVIKVEGSLHGPVCDFSHTLPAECAMRWNEGTCSAESLLLEPCYWTPTLPFQYELEVTITFGSGTTQREKRLIGLRRWATEGEAFFLERRRTVLRGCGVESHSAETLKEARLAETALFVKMPSDDFCEAASQSGVSLLVDLRSLAGPVEEVLQRLSWHPAVMMVLVATEQLDSLGELRSPFLTAVAVPPDSEKPEIALAGCDLFAVELSAEKTPPAWLAGSGKPAIAIRCGETYADCQEGRSACDRLQASLAPEFNLAGYFVSR